MFKKIKASNISEFWSSSPYFFLFEPCGNTGQDYGINGSGAGPAYHLLPAEVVAQLQLAEFQGL